MLMSTTVTGHRTATAPTAATAPAMSWKHKTAPVARPPAPKEQHAQFAVRNMAMFWDMILLPVGHMMITSTGSSVPVAMKRMT